MKTNVVSSNDCDALPKTLESLRSGGVVAFPTDTVYGLGTDAFNQAAILKLFEIKGREFNKAIAVLVGDTQQLMQLTDDLPDVAKTLMSKFWPGGLTLVVNKRADLPAALSSNGTIGVRMPNHPVALALLQRFGPLATTSANLAGGKNPQTAADVLAQLDGRVPLLLDGGACKGGVPSTVVDCTQDPIQILRYGAISETVIQTELRRIKP